MSSAVEPFDGWLPKLVGGALALLVLIVITVAFTFRELKRKRTFYGREEQPSHIGQPYCDDGKLEAQEDDDDERQAAGECLDAIKIVKSIETVRSPVSDSQSHPHSSESMSAPPQSVIKVLYRQRQRRSQPSGQDTPDSPTLTPSIVSEFRFSTELDLIPDRSPALLAIVRTILTEASSGGSALSDSGALCERVVSELRRHLDQQMTVDQWVVHARMAHRWRISGQDNLLPVDVTGTQLMLRLTVTEPLAAFIFALRTLRAEPTPSAVTKSPSITPKIDKKSPAVTPMTCSSLTNSSKSRNVRGPIKSSTAVDESVTMTKTPVSKTPLTSVTSLIITDSTPAATLMTSVMLPSALLSRRRPMHSNERSQTVFAVHSPITQAQRSTDSTASSPISHEVSLSTTTRE